ncbi:FtsW/RodA/SpoVE family cell cycle protein [Pisciglobus halotolerans]|uniref:Probable peptidoglycan glycosyltransferase FtsW n=1 Tax=Pisciglobus halotolerans TaxID=745365 RepID=A0A1I3BEK8_9LACT|nr:FtsW/RodA/SpoVE family cell cycle protein [Pisciglobus halotolerans]SFH60745.1 cell division-specific peptidoglycan biosynthesis regulator FtsW [Pisciglobus halotolerans]
MKKIKYLDYYILIPYLLLTCIGILMVYSASSYIALQNFDQAQYYFIRQTIFSIIGFISCFIVFRFRYALLKNKGIVSMAVIGIGIVLYLLLIFGQEKNGAKGWISIGSIGIQPAEFAKIIVILYFSYFFSRKQKELINDYKRTLLTPSILFFALIIFPVMLQPDVGGALIILSIGVTLIFTSGVSYALGLTVGAIGIGSIMGLVGLVYKFGTRLPFLAEYQYNRFLAFWDPFALSQTSGMQLVNSYYALNRGGLFGVGIGGSVQKTGYLPEPYTDFIISIIGEELGLFGILIVLFLIIFLILRIYLIGIRSKDTFGALLCIGIATMLLIQSSINLGGVLGLLPITGVTFPFISYGGSSTIVLAFSIGLVLNVSATDKMDKERMVISKLK